MYKERLRYVRAYTYLCVFVWCALCAVHVACIEKNEEHYYYCYYYYSCTHMDINPVCLLLLVLLVIYTKRHRAHWPGQQRE